MWLLDSLRSEFRFARIMTYGFNTILQSNKSNQDISDLANFLLGSLEAMRVTTGISEDGHSTQLQPGSHEGQTIIPVIFIAHSLGGLVVKEVSIAFLKSYVVADSSP
jgi:hypothetical protein